MPPAHAVLQAEPISVTWNGVWPLSGDDKDKIRAIFRRREQQLVVQMKVNEGFALRLAGVTNANVGLGFTVPAAGGGLRAGLAADVLRSIRADEELAHTAQILEHVQDHQRGGASLLPQPAPRYQAPFLRGIPQGPVRVAAY